MLMLNLYVLLLVSTLSTCDRVTNVLPSKYAVSLKVNMDKDFSYEGNVTIKFKTVQTGSKILVHSENLTILSSSMWLNDQIPLITNGIAGDGDYTLQINQGDFRPEYLLTLNISFRGYVRNDLRGFYRGTYQSLNTTRIYAATHFESAAARYAFPCFDEPNLKAKFELKITVNDTYNVVSNTPLQQSSLTNGWKTFAFQETSNMSTYLVAWLIFESSIVQTFGPMGKTNYSVLARDEVTNEIATAIALTPQVLDQLETFTGVPYSSGNMTKLDLVALPDLSPGAMENWGLVTFRESYLLYDIGVSNEENFQKTTFVIAHELAHQWFGNKLTLHWWNFVWLNEGFARFFEYFISAKIHPDWRLDEQFVVDHLQQSMKYDKNSSHPLTYYNVSTSQEIDDMFDIISYSKGGSVLRMLQWFLGDENFQNGIKQYLQNNINAKTTATDTSAVPGVVQPRDLWNAFSDVTPRSFLPNGTSIEHVMKGWTEVAGFPIVHAVRLNNSIQIHQNINATPPHSEEFHMNGVEMGWVDNLEQSFLLLLYKMT